MNIQQPEKIIMHQGVLQTNPHTDKNINASWVLDYSDDSYVAFVLRDMI